MKIALIYPPIVDPTAPYLSVPSLTAYLRKNKVEVLPVDANIEACEFLMKPHYLTLLAERIEKQRFLLERKKTLNHREQLAYLSFWKARGDLRIVPDSIEDALSVLRDCSGNRFFDIKQYDTAVRIVEGAFRMISAAYTPLTINFSTFRTPFSLLNMQEVETEAEPEKNPFHEYYSEKLAPLLFSEKIKLVGLSVAFPSQIQPAYSLAFLLRQKLPSVHITVGGPAITKMLARLPEEKQRYVLGPFHSAVLFEGGKALLDLIGMLQQGTSFSKVLHGSRQTDMKDLPAPDFDGLPLEKYLSPALVLPYDPTRGCYWSKCAFCHYGLTEKGTAPYRERPVEQIVEHVRFLSSRYNCRIFYFSQDTMAPKTAFKIAQALQSSKVSCRWSMDIRPEAAFTQKICQTMASAGALSVAIGLESASPRLLQLINKGVSVDDLKKVITHFSDAGVAVETMCFTDFPTETFTETLDTLSFLQKWRYRVSLFMCGIFHLSSGSRVAIDPEKYGLREIWQVEGDELGLGLFFEEVAVMKNQKQQEKIDDFLDNLSSFWRLGHYPWAGSLSTAHTFLWYDKFGSKAFQKLSTEKINNSHKPLTRIWVSRARFDLQRIFRNTQAREEEIWHTLIHKERKVSKSRYWELAALYSSERQKPGQWQYTSGCFPSPVSMRKKRSFRKKGSA